MSFRALIYYRSGLVRPLRLSYWAHMDAIKAMVVGRAFWEMVRQHTDTPMRGRDVQRLVLDKWSQVVRIDIR